MDVKEWRKRWARTTRLPLWAVVGVLAISGLVAASGALFTQTLPAVPVSQSAALTPNCSTLTASPGSVTAGSSGDVGFSCGASAALSVMQSDVALTPTFSLTNTGFSDLWVFPVKYSPASSCSQTWGAMQISSGMSMKFPQTGGWSYCADFMNAMTLGSVNVSWSQ